jgi:AbrB family looped-hinge helix DNA binding protein
MSRVTSKLQVTIPKAIAERYGIEPGEEIDWLPAGEAIRVVPRTDHLRAPDTGRRLDLFDRATERQRVRDRSTADRNTIGDRGWRREDLYDRGVTD